jgi:N-acetylglucosamine kinase-like BadF-type ATPase
MCWAALYNLNNVVVKKEIVMQKYFLGVDGGNTKTDYMLCTTDGRFVDLHRTGQCSHENFDDGFAGMERVMWEQLSVLFNRNGISVENIEAAGFGLAGADLPYQVYELKKRVESIGFTKYGLANDGILGVKGASENGVGLCVVNGTGTVVIGMDKKGDILQVGGVGPLSGDNAGGGYIRDKIISLLYDFHYRCGEDSPMFPRVMELLKIKPEDLLTLISDYGRLQKYMTEIIKIGSAAAVEGDAIAKKIFDDIGETIGRSAAGCIRRLSLDNEVDIVQVGSIWHKIAYNGMNASFLKTVCELSGKNCRIIKLKAPAAVGGVFWAKEISAGVPADAVFRKKVLKDVLK